MTSGLSQRGSRGFKQPQDNYTVESPCEKWLLLGLGLLTLLFKLSVLAGMGV